VQNKEKISKALKELTEKRLQEKSGPFAVTTQDMAQVTGLNRTLISHCLNILNKEGKAIKINTRPVYFLHLDAFQKQLGVNLGNCTTFKSFSELKRKSDSLKNMVSEGDEVFKDVIGCHGSLSYQLEQCKVAVRYPPNGLFMLILGPTGCGKSFLASKIYEYAQKENIVAKSAPFIVYNCAKYANNKELLSASLFGHMKGAFTGANEDREGVIESGNGGFVFLDEVHRLSPEGQEQLFYFMDTGLYRRVGENDKYRKADVRLIFATTERPDSALLESFLRRIPIIVNIPPLRDRPLNEKFLLIHTFLKKESKILGYDIKISKQALMILLNNDFKGNIGQMKNDIKFTCARAYNALLKQGENPRTCIYINFATIPEHLSNYVLSERKDDIDGFFNGFSLNDLLISPDNVEDMEFKIGTPDAAINEDFYNSLLKLLLQCNKEYQDEIQLKKIKQLIDDYFSKLILSMSSYSKEDVRLIRFDTIYKCMQQIFDMMKVRYGIRYYDNIVYKLAYFVEKSVEYYYEHALENYDSLLGKHIPGLKEAFPQEYEIASKIINFIKLNLSLRVGDLETIVILLYLAGMNSGEANCKTKAVLIAHGYSTAGSIANVCNQLLGEYIFESFDMPINTSSDEIIDKLLQYTKETDVSKGLMILVDMGSLEEIYRGLETIQHGVIGIVNNLTTKMALSIGSDISKGLEVEQIIENIKKYEGYKCKIIEKTHKKEKAVIVTCYTGIGTAIKIKNLLTKSLADYTENIKVIAYSYVDLQNNKYGDGIFSKYDVAAIIGTDDPGINEVPFLYLDDLISSGDKRLIYQVFSDIIPGEKIEIIKQSILKYFTLESVLGYITILNPDKLIDQLEEVIGKIQFEMKRDFTIDTKICLYIHLSCLIERLVTKTQLEEKDIRDIEKFKTINREFISVIKRSFSLIEKYYSVTIPTSEIYYLYEILNVKIDLKRC